MKAFLSLLLPFTIFILNLSTSQPFHYPCLLFLLVQNLVSRLSIPTRS